ncbi:MAG: tyrosine-type recombinase/integrase [Actinobacteria bacterium]|nr:tyrosine-type recombinase/integrase [Actinomycetota bacterium]
MPPKTDLDDTPTRRAKGTGTLKDRPDGRCVATVTVGRTEAGRQQRISRVFPSRRAAEQGVKRLVAEAEVSRVKGERPGSARGRRKTKPTEEPLTVRTWIEDHYLPGYVRRVTPQTYSTVRSALGHAVEAYGSRTLETITPGDFAKLVVKVKALTSDVNAFNAIRYFRTALMAAGAQGHAVPSFLPYWQPGRQVKVKKRRRASFTADDARAMFDASEDDPQEHLRVKIGIYYGLRGGGVRGLRWTEVDLLGKRYLVRWQLEPLPYEGPRKEGRFRVPDDFEAIRLVDSLHLTRPKWMRDVDERDLPVLPMPDDLVLAFNRWRAVAPANPWGLVFTDNNGGYPRRESTDRENWRAVQERAGVCKPNGQPYLVHEMRHSLATLLADLKVPREVIASILGHTDVSTSNIYTKESARQREKALKKAERAFRKAARPPGGETNGIG